MLVLTARAADNERFYTRQLPNGRFWLEVCGEHDWSQIAFLYGLESGIRVGAVSGGPKGDAGESFLIKNLTKIEVAHEISRFYEEQVNVVVPIAFAYVYVLRKSNGMPARELDEPARFRAAAR